MGVGLSVFAAASADAEFSGEREQAARQARVATMRPKGTKRFIARGPNRPPRAAQQVGPVCDWPQVRLTPAYAREIKKAGCAGRGQSQTGPTRTSTSREPSPSCQEPS